MKKNKAWTFITNHGLVLSYIYKHPSHTCREISDEIGITERTAHNIIIDLESAGYIIKNKEGRKNLYTIKSNLPLRHHTTKDNLVDDLLIAINIAHKN
ncbi:MAG: ArsR family transcriptional regulator [Chloroflexi bacterium]|nr:ArsR family transcriptional regulator [Chloroflexota bacterium]|tara:strand:- start:3226 stop:3519 length:294 start_codon:yes stop_codon:yes gene_type:complete